LSTAVMFGAMCGAFISGFFSDKFGRKKTTVCSFSTFGDKINLLSSGFIFFVLGAASGGYMVVNIVLMVEAVENARSRLLIVSLNGFPPAMSAMAVIAYLTRYWFAYHMTLALLGIVFSFFLAKESKSWLRQNNCSTGNEETKAAFIAKTPNEKMVDPDSIAINAKVLFIICLFKKKKIIGLILRKIFILVVPLLSLFYCFLISSFVSFAGYFNSSILPGDRYSNLFALGLLKSILALIPFICGRFLRRRSILLLSTALIAALTILMTSALDPNWKVLHLYTTELFPTSVRNTARGFCQGGARIGSVLAPSVSCRLCCLLWLKRVFPSQIGQISLMRLCSKPISTILI
uniref:MFS domain-containing protein n=1 Tax=Dracunculus medinensis TaxID=318479 RepID=A0A0N4UBC8_DRAME